MNWEVLAVTNNDDDSALRITGATVLLIASFYKFVLPGLIKIKSDFVEAFYSIKILCFVLHKDALAAYNSFPLLFLYWRFDFALFVIFLPLLVYFNYRLIRAFVMWQERMKIKKESLKAEKKDLSQKKEEIKKLIASPVLNLSSHDLNELKNKLKLVECHKSFLDLKNDISGKIKEIELELPLVKRQEKMEDLRLKEELAKERVEQMEKAIKEKELQLRNFEETSLRKLNATETPVYVEEDLTEKEKALLLKYDYKRAYEYCVCEQDYVRVLVKPPLRHSVTHTFLVWSVMKLLNKIDRITNVADWDTVEADVIFKYLKKQFALEVETGTLLKKKVQLRRKIEYLQSKYKDSWMIIVSKKSIASKYRQFGLVATRSEVPKS